MHVTAGLEAGLDVRTLLRFWFINLPRAHARTYVESTRSRNRNDLVQLNDERVVCVCDDHLGVWISLFCAVLEFGPDPTTPHSLVSRLYLILAIPYIEFNSHALRSADCMR